MDENERLILELTSEQRHAIQSLFQQKGWQLPKENSGNNLERTSKDAGSSEESREDVELEQAGSTEFTEEPSQDQDNGVLMEVDDTSPDDTTGTGEELFVEVLQSSSTHNLLVDEEEETHVVLDVNCKSASSSVSDNEVKEASVTSERKRRGRPKKVEFEKKPEPNIEISVEPKQRGRSKKSSTKGNEPISSDEKQGNQEYSVETILRALQMRRKVQPEEEEEPCDVVDEAVEEEDKSPVRRSSRKRTPSKKLETPSEKREAKQKKIETPTSKKVKLTSNQSSSSKKKESLNIEWAAVKDLILSQMKDGKYQCFICKNTFTRSAKLSMHLKIHNIDLGVGWKEGEGLEKLVKSEPVAMLGEMTDDTDSDPDFQVGTEGSSSDFTVDGEEGAKMYRCLHKDCGAMFSRFSSYQLHQEIHPHPFKCTKCSRCFNDQFLLDQHMEAHSGKRKVDGDRPFVCLVCNKAFKKSGHLKDHEGIHDMVKNEECHRCGKKFRLQKHLKVHLLRTDCMKTENKDLKKEYQCEVCDASFSQSSLLTYHMTKHQTDRPFSCSICSKTFRLPNQVTAHEKTHSDERPWGCTICDKYFKVKSAMVEHKKTIHGGATKDKLCPTCGKTFYTDSKLRLHIDRNCCGTDNIIKESGKEAFVCDICGKMFGHRRFLEYHTKSHNDDRPFPCSICGKCFKTDTDCRNHEKIHNPERPYICSECGKAFKTKANVKEHEKTHSAERDHECRRCGKRFRLGKELKLHEDREACVPVKNKPCELCEKTFNSNAAYKRHMTQHSTARPFTCQTCGKSYTSKENLASHQHVHSEDRPFQCDQCPKAYRKKQHLLDHLDSHNQSKTHVCQDCGKAFTYAGGLRAHEKKGCENEARSTACNVCNQDFKTAGRLTRHRLTAHGKEAAAEWKCDQCGKLFLQQANLKAHYRVHTGEKPFSCKICGKRFAQKSHVRDHLNFHSGERKYVCRICGNSYPYAGSLRKHLQLHEIKEGDKPYSCKICSKTFSKPDMLAMHMRGHDPHHKKFGYVCENCGMYFKKQSTLAKHKLNEKNPEILQKKRYTCSECGVSFKKPIKKDFHMIKHYYSKPIVCVGCGRRFYNPDSLKRHVLKCDRHPPVPVMKDILLTCYFCRESMHGNKAFLGHIAEHEDLRKPCVKILKNEEDDEDDSDKEVAAPVTAVSGAIVKTDKATGMKLPSHHTSIVIEPLSGKVIGRAVMKSGTSQKTQTSLLKGGVSKSPIVVTQKTEPAKPTPVPMATPFVPRNVQSQLLQSDTATQEAVASLSVGSEVMNTFTVEIPDGSQVEDGEDTYSVEVSNADVSNVLQSLAAGGDTGTNNQTVTMYPSNALELEETIAQIQARSGNQMVILVVNEDGTFTHANAQ